LSQIYRSEVPTSLPWVCAVTGIKSKSENKASPDFRILL